MRKGMIHILLVIALGSGFIVKPVEASSNSVYPWSECLATTAERYGVSPRLVSAIIAAESANDPLAVHVNRMDEGSVSVDMGLMQINSWWLSRIEPLGYDRDSLFDPCVNIEVGVWILAQEIHHYGYTWAAVGAYNAGRSPDRQLRRARYAQRVFEHLGP